MKSKKLISLLCAAALTISSFAGLTITASAAEGDVLHTSTFEDAASKTTEVYKAPAWNDDQTAATTRDVTRVTAWEGNNWGVASDARSAAYYGSATDAVAYMTDMIGSQRVNDTTVWTDTFKPTTVTPPAVTGKKSLYVATQTGMNPTVTLTIAPAVTAAATNAYSVNFDMMLASGDYDGTKTGKKEYTASIADIFKLDVIDDDLYFMDGTTRIDTGIDLTLAGTWFNFDLVFDTNGKQFKGTIKAYDGDTLAATAACDIPWSNFAGNATTIDKAVFAAVRDSSGQKGAVNCAIDNFVVKEAAAVTYTDVTIKYVDGEGATLKDATTAKAETGTTFTASEAYKVPFTTDELRAENKYYKYTGTTDSVEAAEGAEINLVFTVTDMPKGTVKAAVDGVAVAEAFSGYAMPGEKVSGNLSEYIADEEGNWYVKNNGVQTYPADVTLGDTDTESLVAYKPVKGVVSFKEAESDEGTTDGTYSTNYPAIYASGGQWVQSASSGNYNVGFYTDAVETEGEYEVIVRFYDNSGRPMAVAKVAEDGTMEKIGETTNGKGVREESFTAELAAGEKFWVGKTGEIGTDVASDTKAIDDVDYIVVKKTSATPEVEVAYSDNKATLTVTNADDVFENVNAKLIHATYTNGAVSAVKVYNAPLTITADGMGAEVTIPETDAVYKNDKFMVWDSVEGMKPLSAIYIVTEGEDPVVPTPTPAPTDVPTEPTPTPAPTDVPTYSVTVDTAIVNGTVTAAPAANVSAGDTVTLTVEPDADYTIGEVKYNNTVITPNEGVYSFEMPAANVTVTATFTQLPELTGTVTISGTAKVNETVTANVTGAPEGATLKYQWMMASTADGEYAAIDGATAQSRRIASTGQGKYLKVVVTADGYRGSIISDATDAVAEADAPVTTYGITTAADPADTATITTTVDGDTVTAAAEGDTVKVNATAEDGYQVSEIVVMNAETPVTVSANNTFEMPAAAVTVTVKTVQVYTVTITENTNASFTVKNGETPVDSGDTVPVNTVLTIEASAKTGYTLQAVKAGDTTLTAGGDGKYTTTVTADVTITVETEAIPTYTITKTTPENGSFSVSDESAYANTTISITGIDPADGFELDAVTVKDADNADVTTTANEDGTYSFTMPAKAVTVTVTFKAELEKSINAEAATYVKDGDTTPHGDAEEFAVNLADANGIALVRYAGLSSINKERLVSAKIKGEWAPAQFNNSRNRWEGASIAVGKFANIEWNPTTFVYTDYSAAPATDVRTKDRFGYETWTDHDTTTPKNSEQGRGNLTTKQVDVTDWVLANENDKMSFALRTGTARPQAIKNAPTLEIVYGSIITFNVKAPDGTAGAANVAIEVKGAAGTVGKATTDANGVAKIALSAGSYTYSITTEDYALKKDVALTVTTEDANENVTLAANVPTTIAINSPDSTVVTLTETVTFTATVKDQDERVMNDVPLTWSIVDSPANIAVANGTVSATEGVTAGDYTVQAAVTANTDVKATASFNVVTAQPATLKANYKIGEDTVVSKDVFTSTDNKFASDVVEIPAEFRDGQIVKDEETGLYKVYNYVSGGTENITLEAGENTVDIVVAEDTTEYYYANNFNFGTGLEEIADWTASGKKPSGYIHAQTGRAGSLSTANGVFLWTPTDGKTNGTYSNAAYGIINGEKSNITTVTAANDYSISFDWTPTTENTNQDVVLELIDTDKNVVLGLLLNKARNGNATLKYYVGGKCAYKVTEDNNSVSTNSEGYLGENAGSAISLGTVADSGKTYNVTLTVTAATGAATLTIKEGNTVLADNVEVTVGAGKGLSDIYMTAKNWNVSSPQGTISLDNFKIAKVVAATGGEESEEPGEEVTE